MEIELIEEEINEMELIKAECIRKIVYSVEWHWELTGEQIPYDFLIDKVNEQMEEEWYIYNCISVFFEDCEIAYKEICEELFNID